MPIASRQFTMVLNSQFHTHTLTMTLTKKNTCTKELFDFATLIGNSPKSKTKLTHYVKVFSDYLRVANKRKLNDSTTD